MRIKTSVTLDKELLEKIDKASSNRSAFLEELIKNHFKKLDRAKRDAEEIALINKHADWLNEEARDVWEYQEAFLEELEQEEEKAA